MLTGFTLLRVSKGWQCSTQQHDQDGWSVRFITEEQAQMFLSQLTRLDTGGCKPVPRKETPSRSVKKRVLLLD